MGSAGHAKDAGAERDDAGGLGNRCNGRSGVDADVVEIEVRGGLESLKVRRSAPVAVKSKVSIPGLVWVPGDDFDFDEGVFGEGSYLYGGAGGWDDASGCKVGGIDGVHGSEVGHVFEEDRGFYDIGQG
jgi:hypothetical protein